MKSNIFHITNGDALTERLKGLEIKGIILSMRECMIDGPKDTSQDWDVFFKSREEFIYEQFGKELSYNDYVLSQFTKMRAIPAGSEIYFWFEDDLFCQANWWFLLLFLKDLEGQKYLVRSGDDAPYSFAQLSKEQLMNAMQDKIALKTESFSRIWECYKSNDSEGFTKLREDFKNDFPFIEKAFEAHIDRLPSACSLGRPKDVLQQICEEAGSSDFGLVFREFGKRCAMYGYGDLQLRNMLKEFD